MWLVRRLYRDRLRFFRCNVSLVPVHLIGPFRAVLLVDLQNSFRSADLYGFVSANQRAVCVWGSLIGCCSGEDPGVLQSEQSAARVPDAGSVPASDLLKPDSSAAEMKNLLSPLSVHSTAPPLSVVRKFLHLLDMSDGDIREEAELLHLREEVVRSIRFNRQLEADLDLMDLKIGLLVRNRATLQVRALTDVRTNDAAPLRPRPL